MSTNNFSIVTVTDVVPKTNWRYQLSGIHINHDERQWATLSSTEYQDDKQEPEDVII